MIFRSLIFVLFFGLSACGGESINAPQEKMIGMANPAAVYCEEQGGRVEIRKEENGDAGYCHLPDGRVIEEWELFRSQNNG